MKFYRHWILYKKVNLIEKVGQRYFTLVGLRWWLKHKMGESPSYFSFTITVILWEYDKLRAADWGTKSRNRNASHTPRQLSEDEGKGSTGSVFTVGAFVRSWPYSLCAVYMCTYIRRLRLETSGVDAGNRVELGDAALGGGVKALRLSAHLEEHFLFLQLPGKLLLQGLRDTQQHMLLYNHLVPLPGASRWIKQPLCLSLQLVGSWTIILGCVQTACSIC